ncbi:DNA-directed RNA polymerase subunit omega [Fusibacter paucivorans]|uniref:DNA-directed RNA polymerase subunit omega n=1 Tax=Fusibacter paucivorans TaxID=76009 RepID=A0ABS5PR85_9FIRM|nr:DNA-directed RNA polymerase subunit omega [Fusibacter paucivorans]MBS7527427.1 DNA-directed RNA polymerase subunit omega [Fusibacter paucivorans]
MLKPSIDELIEKTGNRYALCIVASRRARNLIAEDEEQMMDDLEKPISRAITEIMHDQVDVVVPNPPKDQI